MREKSKITQQANNYINGSLTDFKKAVLYFSKLDFLNLIQEISLWSGWSVGEVVVKLKLIFE